LDKYRLGADGKLTPQPINAAVVENIAGAAHWACQRARIGLHGKDDPTGDKVTANGNDSLSDPIHGKADSWTYVGSPF
jgi:hypothetical protein